MLSMIPYTSKTQSYGLTGIIQELPVNTRLYDIVQELPVHTRFQKEILESGVYTLALATKKSEIYCPRDHLITYD